MPFITAREDAGLSLSTDSQGIDAIVLANQRLAVDWVQRPDNGSSLTQARLAGNYTCPETRKILSVGDIRFINSSRFEIPADAWLQVQAELATTTLFQAPERATATASSESTKALDLKRLSLEIISHFEGFSPTAYPDPGTGGDPWTIGYGFTRINNRSVQPGQTITRSDADALLSLEIDQYIAKLSSAIPYWDEMAAKQQCALTSFAFNNGIDFYGGPNHQTISRNLKSKDWNSIPQTLLLYVNPGTPVEQGLRRRRQEEGRLWTEGMGSSAAVSVERRPATSVPAASSKTLNGLDPRGSEEQGLVGPNMRAPVKPGDTYLLVNDRDQDMEAYDHEGKLMWKIPCLARGQGGDFDFRHKDTDTPPGLYKVGEVYKDYEKDPSTAFDRIKKSYGWYSLDLIDLENQETRLGRSGIMIHGGGSNCGWPGAWEPRQELFPTCGCIRVHNIDLKEKILPLVSKGIIYVGVFQEQ